MINQLQIMEQRYQRAQALLQGLGSSKLVQNDSLFPHWIEDTDCFWYERTTTAGKEFRLVDAGVPSNNIAFEHDALATALTQASGQPVDKEDLPISYVGMTLSPLTVSFSAFDKGWLFTSSENGCKAIELVSVKNGEALSPNGKQIAFVRNYNLWIREVVTGEAWAVTVDGEEDYAYGGPLTAWGDSNFPEMSSLWSSDSTRLLTMLRDKRLVKTLPTVEHLPLDGSIRPTVKLTKVAYPGDEQVETVQLLAIDVASGDACTPDYPPLPAGHNMNMGLFFSRIAWWANDNRHAYFVALERGDRVMQLVEFDTHTGNTRVLFEEMSETHVNYIPSDCFASVSHRALSNSNELIWWSERSGWGHLYLYDLVSGELKQTITRGDWMVRDVLSVDEQRREIVIQTCGRVPGRDPYYRDICRVQIDTGEITTLFSADEDTTVHYLESYIVLVNHQSHRANAMAQGISPSGDYTVMTRSRVDQAPVSQLLNRDGETLLELEVTDISLLPDGWHWPEPVEVQAADGVTPLYGVLFRPSYFSPDKQYPVINYISGGPWLSIVPKGSFHSSRHAYTDFHYFIAAAFAELGFIVLQLDSRGTPLRGKAFQDDSYGWVPDAANTEDHAGAIRQLAERYPAMDLHRVGSCCLAYLSGLVNFFECQDLYKVHVQANVMDTRLTGCSFHGDIFEGCEGPSDNKCYPEQLAEKLRGKLLLMHTLNGPQVSFYPPAGAFRVIDALQKANKDFDMLMAPGSNDSYGSYASRRIWDYLVTHLMGEEPPKAFKLDASFI